MPSLTRSGYPSLFRCRRPFQIVVSILGPLTSGLWSYTRLPRLLLKKTWDGSLFFHPRPVECISTCNAGRSKCSSSPRGLYHSRRTLCRTTQASKTTPAATDGSNIKFSSVTELFLSSAQPPEERCSDNSRTDPRCSRPGRLNPGGPESIRKAYLPARLLWTLRHPVWCTFVNAIGWPFFEPMYRRLLDKTTSSPLCGNVQRIAHYSFRFPPRYGRNSPKGTFAPCFHPVSRVGTQRALITGDTPGESCFPMYGTRKRRCKKK